MPYRLSFLLLLVPQLAAVATAGDAASWLLALLLAALLGAAAARSFVRSGAPRAVPVAGGPG